MKINEIDFNNSVEKSFVKYNSFDAKLCDFNNKTNFTYFQILNKLCEINNVEYNIEEEITENSVGTSIHYLGRIKHNNNTIKEVKISKGTDLSSWFGKELLYFFRDNNFNNINEII